MTVSVMQVSLSWNLVLLIINDVLWAAGVLIDWHVLTHVRSMLLLTSYNIYIYGTCSPSFFDNIDVIACLEHQLLTRCHVNLCILLSYFQCHWYISRCAWFLCCCRFFGSFSGSDKSRSWYHSFADRSEEHTSELQSPVPISYAVFCLKKKKK